MLDTSLLSPLLLSPPLCLPPPWFFSVPSHTHSPIHRGLSHNQTRWSKGQGQRAAWRKLGRIRTEGDRGHAGNTGCPHRWLMSGSACLMTNLQLREKRATDHGATHQTTFLIIFSFILQLWPRHSGCLEAGSALQNAPAKEPSPFAWWVALARPHSRVDSVATSPACSGLGPEIAPADPAGRINRTRLQRGATAFLFWPFHTCELTPLLCINTRCLYSDP